MHPHTARALVAALEVPGAVLDPFMGGGTVVVEAMLAGRGCYGRDVNPIALEVAWARTRLWSPARREALVARARATVTAAEAMDGQLPDGALQAERRWFDPPALVDIWRLQQTIAREGDVGLQRMLRACLSSLIIKASKQVSDSVPRQDERHKWVPARRVGQWLIKRAEEHARGLAALSEAVGPGGTKPRLALGDAREDDARLAGKLAAVITSPPYPGVYDYAHHQRRRYRLLGIDGRGAERSELGARREFARKGVEAGAEAFERDLARAMTAWRVGLVDGGRVFLVIGDGQHERGAVPVLPLVAGAARAAGLEVMASVSQGRPVFGAARREAPGTQREEHIVALGPVAEADG